MTDETTQALLPVTPELLPCPKCGGRAFIPPHPTGFPVWCVIDRCLRLPPRETKAEAITAWNTRLAHSLPSQADAGERSKIVAWLRSIDEGPLKGWQPNALANAIERGDYFRLADESLAVDQLQAMGQDFDATSGEEMRLREENARLRAHIAASANSINAAGSAYDEAIAALDRLVAETKSSARAALTKGADRHD